MEIHYLVKMANEIGAFFRAEASGEEDAAKQVARHLKRYWDPRMRKQIIEHYREAKGEGLDALAHRAVGVLAAEPEKP
jgi:formate dehydrogenase subunit delta